MGWLIQKHIKRDQIISNKFFNSRSFHLFHEWQRLKLKISYNQIMEIQSKILEFQFLEVYDYRGYSTQMEKFRIG